MASNVHRLLNNGARPGSAAETPAEIPPRGWKEIAVRTWKEGSKDNISIVAAGVAFYGLLAMVPLLGATVLTYGLVASPDTVLHNVQSLASSLPKDVAKLVGDQLLNVVKTSGGKKGLGLLIALAVALWGARNAASSMITALNIAYEEQEKRGFVKVTLLSLAITFAGVVLGMIGAVVVGLMAKIQAWLPSLGSVGIIAGRVVAYLMLGAVAAAAAATLYRYGPSRAKAKWEWISPGSVFFAVGWVLLTLGFGFYVSHFGKYNVTYGSLGGVIVFITWLYLSAFILLYGAEFNSEVEQQTAKDTTDDASAKPLGDRGAWSADHVAGGTKSGDSRAAQLSDKQAREPSDLRSTAQLPHEHPYLVARATNRAGSILGMQKVGMVSAALSTLGLSLLRRRGREGAGAALLAGAVGLSLLKRKG
ncbi:MAG TPA: YihY/virulence factor BrkB family protein [Sphingomicrobium sp.]|nr:YihY/virulence factor BrkB family protein [Sphingomicrobium sp.]